MKKLALFAFAAILLLVGCNPNYLKPELIRLLVEKVNGTSWSATPPTAAVPAIK